MVTKPQILHLDIPERVSHMFSMSGSFDIKSFVGDYYDDNVFFNNPVDYLPSARSSRFMEHENCSRSWRMGYLLRCK